MLFRILMTIAIASALQSSCKTLSNNFSDLKSDCGSDVVYGGEYLKFLSPSGAELSGSELSSLNLSQNKKSESLHFTQKGCALKNELFATAVRSNVKDRHWGVVISESDLRAGPSLRLKDISSWNPKFECPRDAMTKGLIRSPLTWDMNLASVLPQYTVADKNTLKVVDSIGSQDIELSFLDRDGEHELEFSWLDPYQGTKSAKCKYQLDRSAPTVSDELNQMDEKNQYRVSGGSRLRLAVVDTHAASLEYCLYRPGETCQLLKTGPETFVTFPSAGRWCLESTAIDQAGNRSETRVKCGISIAEGELALLLANLQNAKHFEPTVPLLQPILILRALKQYFALETDEERQSVANDMLSAAVSYGAQTYVRGMHKDQRFDYMIKFSKHWATISEDIFELRDQFGRIIKKQKLSDLIQSKVETKGNNLITMTDKGELKILELNNETLVQKQKFQIPVGPTSFNLQATWNPWNDSFSISEQRTSGDRFQFVFYFFQKGEDGNFILASTVVVDDPDPKTSESGISIQPMRWSGDGNYAAVSTRLHLIAFRKNPKNNFELITLLKGRTRDVAIIQEADLNFVLSLDEEKIINIYDLNKNLEKIESEEKLKAKNNFLDESFLQAEKNSVYFLDYGISKLKITNNKVDEKASFGEIKNFSTSAWTYNEPNKLIAYQSFKDISLFRKREKYWEQLGVIPFETPVSHRPYGHLAYAHLENRIITSSDDSILRTWDIKPLVGKILIDLTDTNSELSNALSDFIPAQGEIPSWVYERVAPYSKLSEKSGKETVSKIYKSRYSSDFATMSAHKVLVFYDHTGKEIGIIETGASDFKRFSLSFIDSSHVLLINEDLEYLIMEKRSGSYQMVYRGSSESKDELYSLKPIELLKLSIDPYNKNTIKICESLIDQNSKTDFTAAQVSNDLKSLVTIDDENLVTIFFEINGYFTKHDSFRAENSINNLKWNNEDGTLDIGIKGKKIIRYNPTKKQATTHLQIDDFSEGKAVFYDNNLNISNRFQISFLGSDLNQAQFSESKSFIAFTLSPHDDNESNSNDSIITPARGIDGIYLVPTDLRKIQQEMCLGLDHFLKVGFFPEDWEGLKKSDTYLCDSL